jgi:hypothetical protein
MGNTSFAFPVGLLYPQPLRSRWEIGWANT